MLRGVSPLRFRQSMLFGRTRMAKAAFLCVLLFTATAVNTVATFITPMLDDNRNVPNGGGERLLATTTKRNLSSSGSSSSSRESQPKKVLAETRQQVTSPLTILPDACRCEYPGEAFYATIEDDKKKGNSKRGRSRRLRRSGSNSSGRTSYLRDKNKILVIPSSHKACRNIIYICPGDIRPEIARKWTCPPFDLLPSKGSGSKRRTSSSSRRNLKRSWPRSKSGSGDEVNFTFGGNIGIPARPTWVLLPVDHAQCVPTSSDETPEEPTPAPTEADTPSFSPTRLCSGNIVFIDFETDSEGKSLGGDTCVSDEWIDNGLKLSTIDGCQDIPCLLDSSSVKKGKLVLGTPNRECGEPGPGRGKGGLPGKEGENCVAFDNILLDDCGGKLVFEFSPSATTFYEIGFLNIRRPGTVVKITYIDDEIEDLDVPTFGVNSAQTFKVDRDNVQRIEISFSDKGAVTFLSYCNDKEATRAPTLSPAPTTVTAVPTNSQSDTIVPSTSPPSEAPIAGGGTLAPSTTPSKFCLTETVTFDTAANGTMLPGGEYVQNEWQAFGMSLSCSGKKIYRDVPRLFNTSNPVDGDYGDSDLGSPNRACESSGPGIGNGGAPGEKGENCSPLGNVLICQEDNDNPDVPDDVVGSNITFDFKSSSTEVLQIGMLDASKGTVIIIETIDGAQENIPVEALGENANQTISINKDNVVKLVVSMSKSGAVTFISFCYEPESLPPFVTTQVPTQAPAIVRPTSDACINGKIDFNTLPNGTVLNGGDYIGVQYKPFYGVVFSADGGLRNVPRLFDTAMIGNITYGDSDLGSPNTECPGGGPGIGEGGAPGPNGKNPYQNCDYLGNVLIIQEDNGYEEQPDDNQEGGVITVDFSSTIINEVYEIELLDVDYRVSITMVYIDNDGKMKEKNLPVPITGDNSLQSFALNEKNVVQLRLNSRRSGAIASLSFCYTPQEEPSPSPTIGGRTLSPTRSPQTEFPTRASPFPASPTRSPTISATEGPTKAPTESPTPNPTQSTTSSPTKSPTRSPTTPSEPPTCEEFYGDFVLCITRNDSSCNVCNPSSPGLKPSDKCELFLDWNESNMGCCDDNECDKELEAFANCKKCETAAPTRATLAVPTRSPLTSAAPSK